MNWQRVLLEIFCMYDTEEATYGPPPIYCKFGPGSPDAHCLTGETGEKMQHPLEQDVSSHPCPYAGYKRGRCAVVVTNQDGDQHFSNEFWEEKLADELWEEEQKRWLSKTVDSIRLANEPN